MSLHSTRDPVKVDVTYLEKDPQNHDDYDLYIVKFYSSFGSISIHFLDLHHLIDTIRGLSMKVSDLRDMQRNKE